MNETSPSPALPAPKAFDWRLFLTLGLLGFVASFLVIPYALALTDPETLAALGGGEASALVMTVVGQVCNGGLLFPLVALGLLAAGRLGLGAPILQGWFDRRPLKAFAGKALLWGFVSGLLGGAVVVGLSSAFGILIEADYARLGLEVPNIQAPPPWMGFLASISAGVTEEIMLRLFLMSGLAWLGSLIWRTPEGKPRLFVLWGANILSAVAFGLLHFPLATSLDLVTPLALLNTLLMNALLGILFGWLYMKHGLESAMMGHFSTDLVLHVLVPLLFP
ncbi:MAG: CPBP family intramembrane glutamic endopeptidase [Anaerolineales bacterium]